MALWKKLLWIVVTILGLASVCVLALSRGESVSALWIVTAGFCAAAISYRFYSKWLAAKVLVLNDERATPAVVQNDGKDFVPTNRWMVFGHHFAAIAGPGSNRAHQRARDHDYSFGRPRARRRASAGQKPVGRVHDCNDNSDRADHGSRSSQRKIQRGMDHRVWIGWAHLCSLGRTISRAISGNRSLVST